MQFEKLPHEVNRSIGSFLDYNSRMEFSRVLTDKEDRFVRKLDSDAHNCKFNLRLMKSIIDGLSKEKSLIGQAQCFCRIFDYLAYTEDTILLDAKPVNPFLKTCLSKAREFTDINSDNYIVNIPYELKMEMFTLATAALHRLETHVPAKILNFKPKVVEIV